MPAEPSTYNLIGKAYDLRHIVFGSLEGSSKTMKSLDVKASPSSNSNDLQSEVSVLNSAWHFEAVASFRLIWWDQGSNSRKKLSVWRPVVPQGMIYFGDIAVNRYNDICGFALLASNRTLSFFGFIILLFEPS